MLLPENLSSVFVLAFVVIDPLGVALVVAGVTAGYNRTQQAKLALYSLLIATGILLVFFAFGQALLAALGISFSSFRIGGGILLLLVAIEMLLERRTERKENRAQQVGTSFSPESFAVFPIALPFLAGPATITAVMMQTENFPLPQAILHFSVFIAVLLMTGLMIYHAQKLTRFVSMSVIQMINRLLAILLAAWAVELIVTGLKNVWLTI